MENLPKTLSNTFELGGPQDLFYSPESKGYLPLIVRAKGIYMWDDTGKELIDLSSGPVISNIGHGSPEVANAMWRQASQLDYAYSRVARSLPNILLARKLSELAGKGFERVFLTSGGSEAVEVAIKLARQYRFATGEEKKTKVISLMPSYHGATLAATGLSGDTATEAVFGPMAVFSTKINAPFTYRIPENHTVVTYALACANELEQSIVQLGPENVLAFILEPVGGLATGANVPPLCYFEKIRQICNKYGVFLIFDEVMAGAGRTGKFLAAHHWPTCNPDMVILAKGVGAGYTPLGVVLASAELTDHLAALTGFNNSYTYNANPITCATALAVLEEVVSRDLIGNAEKIGKKLRSELVALAQRHKIIGDVRGLGLLLAVELVANTTTKESLNSKFNVTTRVREIGNKNGLMIYSRKSNDGRFGDWFMVSPPLTTTMSEAAEMVKRLEQTIITLEDEVFHLSGEQA